MTWRNLVGWKFTGFISKHSRGNLNKKIRSDAGMALCLFSIFSQQAFDMSDFLPKSL